MIPHDTRHRSSRPLRLSGIPRLTGLLLGLALPVGLVASEVDSFTAQLVDLQDVAPLLNAETNRRLDQAIAEANTSGGHLSALGMDIPYRPCEDPDALYHSIERNLGRGVISPLEEFIHDSTGISQFHPTKDQTVYRDFRFYEAPSLGISPGRIAAIVRLGERLIGADKFGHFFTEGYIYFERAYLDGEGIEAAFDYGERTERTYYGALLTGVYSYADLTANFDGMRFWVHLLDNNADPLDGYTGHHPYVVCRNDRWVRVRNFDWMDYANPAWDETINCNAFRNPELAARVDQAIGELEWQSHRHLNCPLSRDAFPALRRQYGKYFPRLINPGGHTVMPEANPRAHASPAFSILSTLANWLHLHPGQAPAPPGNKRPG